MDENDLLDDDLDGDTEESETEAPREVAEDPRFKKLQSENVSLRRRLRRTEIEAAHGPEVAGLIPESLPLKEWKDYAEKLATFKTQAVTETTDEAPPDATQEDRAEREQRLAAVGTPRTPANADQADIDPKDIPELMKSDPARAMQVLNARYGT